MTAILGLDGQKLSSEKKTLPPLKQYTNRDLYDLFQEYIQLNRGLTGIFLRSKLREFYNNNFLRYKSLIERMEKLQEEYFEFEPDQKSPRGKKPIVIELEVEGKKHREQKMQEGKTYLEYTTLLAEIMNEPTTIVG